MRKVSDLNGTAVIDIQDGEKLGHIDEVVISPDDLRLLGFVVKSGGMLDQKEWVVEADDVRSIGADAVTVDRRDAAHTSDASSDAFREARSGNRRLNGKKVVTDGGKLLGTVSDVLMDESTKRITGLQIGGGILQSADTVHADHVVSVGPDVIVAQEA